MDVWAFFKGLPAVLGVVAFFAYIWMGQSRIGGAIFNDIVKKLRASPNIKIKDYYNLTPSKLKHLANTDAKIRANVNDQDWRLLRLLIILQHSVTAIVLVISGALIVLGIWLVTKPQPLSIEPKPLASHWPVVSKTLARPSFFAIVADAAPAGRLLLDLDPLTVEWASSGTAEHVAVFLENVDTARRSPKHSTSSSAKSVTFDVDDVLSVATVREYRGKNRVRYGIEWSDNTVYSPVADLYVGIRVELMLFATEISAGFSKQINYLMATIDGSTENMPRDYCFTGDLVGVGKSKEPVVVPLRFCNESFKLDVSINILDAIDWNRRTSFVHGGPDDSRIVRTCVEGQPGDAKGYC